VQARKDKLRAKIAKDDERYKEELAGLAETSGQKVF
jgi:flagellin-like hook-associated protein FlgL